MDAQELLGQARDAMTARRVFGEPIERDGTLVLPVASVMGGAGGGTGRMVPMTGETGAAAEGAAPGEGSGYGFGLMARPLGVYVIRGDEVAWEPAVDRNRQLLLGALIAMLVIWSVRSVLVSIARR